MEWADVSEKIEERRPTVGQKAPLKHEGSRLYMVVGY